MKTDLFQSCGHCWVFQTCWHTECGTLTASSFRIWNSSTGIPSPSLALFVVMLPKAHLSSHSRMSGSRWVKTPSQLTGSLRSYYYFYYYYYLVQFCVFLPPLLNRFCFCQVHIVSLLYCANFAWNVPLVSVTFLRRYLFFDILLFFSISLHWPPRKAFLSLLGVLWETGFK